MMIEESETPGVGSQSDASADVLAERRARHADPAVIRRADAAEAAVRNLETHLAALERRLEEVGRERERISRQLTERESDVREVKQREYAEQQLRVEAEERAERIQQELHAEIQELGHRIDDTEHQARELRMELEHLRERDAKLGPMVGELMGIATKLRSGFEREFTALREEFQRQVVWERETYVRELTAMGARMEDLRFELTRTADDLRAQLAAEPPSASLLEHTTEPNSEREVAHRREMADALVAAVERLRARVAEVKEAEAAESTQSFVEEQPVAAPPVVESPVEEPVVIEPPMEEAEVERAYSGYVPAKESPVVAAPVVVSFAKEPAVVDPPVEEVGVERAYSGYVPGYLPAQEPPVAREPIAEQPAGGEPIVEQPARGEPLVSELAVDGLPVEGFPVEQLPPEEPPVRDTGLGGAHREEPPAPQSPLSGLSPSGMVSAKIVTSEPVALQTRLLSVPEKRISWLAPAIRRLAEQRDAKLAAELVIELLPAQRQIVDRSLNYEIKINELGAFYVTLDPANATISREPRGSVDFSLEGPVAAFSELAAGGTSRRHRGLRIRKGRGRARGLLKARRQPVALADLAAGEVDVWPGLLLLAMAEAIDPSWTTGRRFELAFDVEDASGIVIYIRICDGEPILVSRTAVGQPVATVSLSGHALICLLAGVRAPAEHTTLVTGDATSVDMFLQWTARAQGLSAVTS